MKKKDKKCNRLFKKIKAELLDLHANKNRDIIDYIKNQNINTKN